MALSVSLNGVSYSVPEVGDSNWAANLSLYLQALATAFPQTAGSVGFTALTSATANPAAAGQIRLAKTDQIRWRNTGNTADGSLNIGNGAGFATDELFYTNAAGSPQQLSGNPYARAHLSAAQTTGAPAAYTTIIWNVEDTDSDAAYDPATGLFTVPANKAGQYLICYSVGITQNVGTGQIEVVIVAGGSLLTDCSPMSVVPIAGTLGFGGSVVVNLSAGDTAFVKFKTSTNTATTSNAVPNCFTVKRLV